MKKVLFTLLLVICSVGAFAQKGSMSAHAKMGYQSDYKRFGIGVEGRYEVIDNVRFAPDLVFFFKNNHVWGADINLNFQYTFRNLLDNLTVYPLAGLNISNNRWSYGGESVGFTNWGFNLGAGADYDLSKDSYLNFDIKYTFADTGYGQFMLGYGIRF